MNVQYCRKHGIRKKPYYRKIDTNQTTPYCDICLEKTTLIKIIQGNEHEFI